MLGYKTETRPGLIAMYDILTRKRSGSILTTPEPARGTTDDSDSTRKPAQMSFSWEERQHSAASCFNHISTVNVTTLTQYNWVAVGTSTRRWKFLMDSKVCHIGVPCKFWHNELATGEATLKQHITSSVRWPAQSTDSLLRLYASSPATELTSEQNTLPFLPYQWPIANLPLRTNTWAWLVVWHSGNAQVKTGIWPQTDSAAQHCPTSRTRLCRRIWTGQNIKALECEVCTTLKRDFYMCYKHYLLRDELDDVAGWRGRQRSVSCKDLVKISPRSACVLLCHVTAPVGS